MKKKRNTWIPVVTGFIKKDNKVLVGQRPEDGTLAGAWEFPGGKIELGESPEVALHRELQEELGIDAEIGELKIASTHNYNDIGIVLLFFDVLFWKGEVKPVHHSHLKWIEPEELRNLNLPDANQKIVEQLVEACQS